MLEKESSNNSEAPLLSVLKYVTQYAHKLWMVAAKIQFLCLISAEHSWFRLLCKDGGASYIDSSLFRIVYPWWKQVYCKFIATLHAKERRGGKGGALL